MLRVLQHRGDPNPCLALMPKALNPVFWIFASPQRVNKAVRALLGRRFEINWNAWLSFMTRSWMLMATASPGLPPHSRFALSYFGRFGQSRAPLHFCPLLQSGRSTCLVQSDGWACWGRVSAKTPGPPACCLMTRKSPACRVVGAQSRPRRSPLGASRSWSFPGCKAVADVWCLARRRAFA